MDELERRLRASLAERAEDVEPTPELWNRVEGAMTRRTYVTWGLGVAAAATAAALAVFVVIPSLDGNVDPPVIDTPPSEQPTEAPTDRPTTPSDEPTNATDDPTEPAGLPGDVPEGIVTSDGTSIVLRDLDGRIVVDLVSLPAGGEATVEWLAVRPGSTRDDLTVIFGASAEGMADLRYVTVRDGGQPEVAYFPDQYQPAPDTPDSAVGQAVWTPEGDALAWLEQSGGAGQVTLRTIGWADGPGTGDPATDNASFVLAGLPERPYDAEDWIWTEGDAGTTYGTIYATGVESVDAFAIPIQRQADGALAMDPAFAAEELTRDGWAIAEVADTHTGAGALPRPRVLLLARGNGTQDAEGVEWELRYVTDDGTEVAIPIDLGATAFPGGAWLDASGDYAVAGLGQIVTVVLPDGDVRSLVVGAATAVDLVPGAG